MEELKPCPFCGGEMTLWYSSKAGAFLFKHKQATTCYLTTPFEIVASPRAHSLAGAARAWNRRANNG